MNRFRRTLTMFSLILAGEAIFVPPFHLGRYFKSSLLTTFGIDEFQLGQLGAIYGLVAMASYFLGGPLADYFSPRKLMAASLTATGFGALYMAVMPGFAGLYLLFGFWGASTILIFWAPLIRATRQWGGVDGQGRAFGLLDSGRGFAAALIAAIAAYAFAVMVDDARAAEPARLVAAMQALLCAYSGCCFLAALCVWQFVPDPQANPDPTPRNGQRDVMQVWRHLNLVLRMPAVWLQAVVIMAAYSMFKMFDNFGLYAEDAYGLSPTESAGVTAYLSFLRAVAPLAAGWIADRLLGVSVTIELCFVLLSSSCATFLLVNPGPDLVWLMIVNMAISCAAFFALRGIYFALLEDSGVPGELTGTAVGVICFLGFTPEIFMPPVTGWLIREARAGGDVLVGYDRIYWLLMALTLLGWLAARALRRIRA